MRKITRWVLAFLVAASGFRAWPGTIEGRQEEDDRPIQAGSPEASREEGPSHGGSSQVSPLPVVELSEESFQRGGFRLVPVEKKRIPEVLLLTGIVTHDDDRTANLTPKMEGIVRQVHHTLGDRVEAGDPLVLLDSVPLGNAKVELLRHLQEVELARADLARKEEIRTSTAQLLELVEKEASPLELESRTRGLVIGANRERILTTYSDLRLAQQAHDRERLLFEQKISSGKTLQEATRNLEISRAAYRTAIEEVGYTARLDALAAGRMLKTKELAYRTARRQLEVLGASSGEIEELERGKDQDLSLFTMRAPFRGTVIDRRVSLGERATPDRPLFTLADLDHLWVLADVFESGWSSLKPGSPATLRVPAHPGRSFTGTVTVVPPSLDPVTRTTRVRVEVANKEGLLAAGMFASVEIARGERDALVVPAAALQDIDGLPRVFLREREFSFRPVTVVTGWRDAAGESVEILTGLTLADTVVAEGSFLLKSEIQKEGLEDED